MIYKYKGFTFLTELAMLSNLGTCRNPLKFVDTLHRKKQIQPQTTIKKPSFYYWFICESDK